MDIYAARGISQTSHAVSASSVFHKVTGKFDPPGKPQKLTKNDTSSFALVPASDVIPSPPSKKARKKDHFVDVREEVAEVDTANANVFAELRRVYSHKLDECAGYIDTLKAEGSKILATLKAQATLGMKLLRENEQLRKHKDAKDKRIVSLKSANDKLKRKLDDTKEDLKRANRITREIREECDAANKLAQNMKRELTKEQLANSTRGKGGSRSEKMSPLEKAQLDLKVLEKKTQLDIMKKKELLRIQDERKDMVEDRKRQAKSVRARQVKSNLHLLTDNGAVQDGMFQSDGMRSLGGVSFVLFDPFEPFVRSPKLHN